MRLGLGLSIYYSANSGAGGSLGQTIALNHYNRVTAAGGVLPCGVAALAAIINAICTALNLTTEAQFQAAVPQGLDPHYSGYLAGAGGGVTLGQACQKIFNWAGASGDVSQGTAGSMPLLLAHTSGNNYAWFSGVNGNYCSTPNAVSNQLYNDFSFEVKMNQIDGAANGIYSKYNSVTNYAYRLQTSASGLVELFLSTNGTSATNHQSTVAFTQNYLRVSRNATTGDVKFYQSNDGITYTQLGATINNGITGTLFASTQTVLIGALVLGSTGPFLGKIFYLKLFSDANFTTLSMYFNPNSYNAATSQTSWTSTTGETWTLNVGTATTGYKACIVDRMIMQGDGVDDFLVGSANRPNILTQYLATNTFTNDNSGNAVLVDSNSGSYLNSIVAFTSIVGNIMNGFASDLTKSKSANVLFLVTTSNNSGVKNAISGNNGSETTNAYTPAISGNGFNLFSRSSGGTKSNAIISTYVVTNSQDDSTVRAAMYNIIRSMNNNAF